jgi:hypothetical protein
LRFPQIGGSFFWLHYTPCLKFVNPEIKLKIQFSVLHNTQAYYLCILHVIPSGYRIRSVLTDFRSAKNRTRRNRRVREMRTLPFCKTGHSGRNAAKAGTAHMKKRAGQIDLSASDCQKICLAASLGGKESVKGNRQGFLSR